ncbi:unnamed protein product [Trichogramma brassicae]|uniref:Uncharacterized protein n=1 Tax=Trichogramma brassicae TaxID=86971 RepID=A0A6H5INQ8_9HYME|nr:unnamed protein product [Trichogramma brassicae]
MSTWPPLRATNINAREISAHDRYSHLGALLCCCRCCSFRLNCSALKLDAQYRAYKVHTYILGVWPRLYVCGRGSRSFSTTTYMEYVSYHRGSTRTFLSEQPWSSCRLFGGLRLLLQWISLIHTYSFNSKRRYFSYLMIITSDQEQRLQLVCVPANRSCTRKKQEREKERAEKPGREAREVAEAAAETGGGEDKSSSARLAFPHTHEPKITATGRGIPEGHPLPRRASPGQVHSGAREGGHPCPGRLQPGEGEAPPRPAVPGPHSARSSGDPPATQRLEGQEGEREVGSRESTNSCEEDPGEEVAPSIPQILRHRGTDPYCRLKPQHQEDRPVRLAAARHFLRHLHRSTGRSNARLTTMYSIARI